MQISNHRHRILTFHQPLLYHCNFCKIILNRINFKFDHFTLYFFFIGIGENEGVSHASHFTCELSAYRQSSGGFCLGDVRYLHTNIMSHSDETAFVHFKSPLSYLESLINVKLNNCSNKF